MTRLALILILAGCVAPGMDDCTANTAGLDRYCGGEVQLRQHEPERPEEPEEPREPEEPDEREVE